MVTPVVRVRCPVCGDMVKVERDGDGFHLALHGAWPLCDGSGMPVQRPAEI